MARGKTAPKHVYKVIFLNQGKVYEIFAREVTQGSLFGFVEVEQLLFGERSKIIVDSSEESLKTEFAGVSRVFIPMHAVIRIDVVEKEGSSRIRAAEGVSNVAALPFAVPTPGRKPDSH